MKKIITIVGARPQFIKAAALSRKIKQTANMEEIIVHTGQHYDKGMSDVFFKEMEIPKPHYNLNINGIGHGAMTGRMLEEIEKVLIKEKPDTVLVYGDTNSTLAGALAAKKLHIKVAHVEAGLRSFNMQMPEEINRILTDRISDYLFCPTEYAVNNLTNEGFNNFPSLVKNTGDIMQDAALFYGAVSHDKKSFSPKDKYGEYILATVHRAENTDNLKRLKGIIDALNEINDAKTVVLPIHPRTKGKIQEYGLSINFETLNPVGYFDMIELIKNSSLVMTDSGGLQKEAYFFSKPVVTMRDQTEWVELVDNGFNILTGANKDAIIEAFKNLSIKKLNFTKELYGGGKAADKIIETLIHN